MKDNDILKEKLDNIEDDKYEKENETKQVRKELALKDQVLQCVVFFVPEDLKEDVVEMLQVS